MNPDDYHLLAGDEYFMRWRVDDSHQFMALTRAQMKDMQDAGILNGEVLGSNLNGKKVPPWLWEEMDVKDWTIALYPNEEDNLNQLRKEVIDMLPPTNIYMIPSPFHVVVGEKDDASNLSH